MTTKSEVAGLIERRFRHKKRGTVYSLIGEAELQASSDLLCDGSEMVIYRGEDGKVWARQIDEFHDGRFEEIEGLSHPHEASGEVVQEDYTAGIELWFFRELSDDQRRKLIELTLGKDCAEEAKPHAWQRLCLKRILRAHRLAHSGVGNVVASERKQIDFDSAAALSAERELRNKLDWLCHTDEVWPLVEAYRAALSTTEPVELQTDREKGA